MHDRDGFGIRGQRHTVRARLNENFLFMVSGAVYNSWKKTSQRFAKLFYSSDGVREMRSKRGRTTRLASCSDMYCEGRGRKEERKRDFWGNTKLLWQWERPSKWWTVLA